MDKKEIGKRPKLAFTLDDKCGRRSGVDRRQFSYDKHIPERRSGKDRRSGKEQRNAPFSRKETKPTSDTEKKDTLH